MAQQADEEVGMMQDQGDATGIDVFNDQPPAFEWAVGVKGEKKERERKPGRDPDADCIEMVRGGRRHLYRHCHRRRRHHHYQQQQQQKQPPPPPPQQQPGPARL